MGSAQAFSDLRTLDRIYSSPFVEIWGRFCGLARICRQESASAQGCPFPLFSLLRCVGHFCGRASVTPCPLWRTVRLCELASAV